MRTGEFNNYMALDEGLGGYALSGLMGLVAEELFAEARKQRQKLAAKTFTPQATLFGPGEDPEQKITQHIQQSGQALVPPREGPAVGQKCEKTPLSGYARHIGAIQNFARSSPDNFAQVLMFSPLSANTPFAKHWDNFYVLMMILKHFYPNKVTREQLEHAVDSFSDKYHKLAHTIGGWKLETIAKVWSERHELFHELNSLAAQGDDVALIRRLIQLPGVQPVKAGFIAQLLWGRAGCIDTHNIDIYSKVFPDLERAGAFGKPTAELEPGEGQKDPWQAKGGSEAATTEKIKKYTGLLGQLEKRGIGSQQLWDVWVDFVESMYIMVTHHGKGYYGFMGGALDPSSPEYQSMKGITIPKKGIGKDVGGVMVPLARGRVGMGASATHLPMDPDEALKQFYRIHRLGQRGSEAARAVAFHKDPAGMPLDQSLGMEPSALHYFSPAVGARLAIDPDEIRRVIRDRLAGGKGPKATAARLAAQQRSFA
jgi:hypothetical protein